MEHAWKASRGWQWEGISTGRWISLEQLDLLETAVFLHLARLGECGLCFIMGGCISSGSLYRFQVRDQPNFLHLRPLLPPPYPTGKKQLGGGREQGRGGGFCAESRAPDLTQFLEGGNLKCFGSAILFHLEEQLVNQWYSIPFSVCAICVPVQFPFLTSSVDKNADSAVVHSLNGLSFQSTQQTVPTLMRVLSSPPPQAEARAGAWPRPVRPVIISSPQHLPFYCFIYKRGKVNWENRGRESVWAIQTWRGSWVSPHQEGRVFCPSLPLGNGPNSSGQPACCS